MFCSQCGTSLEVDSSFCSQCGSPTGSKQTEGCLGIIPQVIEVRGFLGQGTRFMNLIVTRQSLILANQGEQLEEAMDTLGDLLDAALVASGDQWRQLADSYSFSARPWDSYLNKGVQEILREHPDNREIAIGDLDSVRLELSDDSESRSDTLFLKTGAQTLELDLPWGNGNLARQLLSQVVPVQVG